MLNQCFAISANLPHPLCQPAPTSHFMMTFSFKENDSEQCLTLSSENSHFSIPLSLGMLESEFPAFTLRV